MSTAVGIQATSELNFSYSWAGSPKIGHFGVAGQSGPLLSASLAAAAGGFFRSPGGGSAGGSLGFGIGRVEAHPDRQFFFAQDVPGDKQEAIEAFAEQRLPLLANHGKLLF